MSLYLGEPSSRHILGTDAFPVALTILPNGPSADTTTATLHSSALAAGQPLPLCITPRDAHSNPLLPTLQVLLQFALY